LLLQCVSRQVSYAAAARSSFYWLQTLADNRKALTKVEAVRMSAHARAAGSTAAVVALGT
jgi:hypothetical protein